LKLLVDVDDWPFFGKTKLIFFAPLFKKRSRATGRWGHLDAKNVIL